MLLSFHELWKKRMNRQSLLQAYIRKEIAYRVNLHKEGVTIKKVRSHLKDKLSINISWYQIRRYLKSVMKLSYKKGCTRRVNINQNKLSFNKNFILDSDSKTDERRCSDDQYWSSKLKHRSVK